ncbi:MAG: permease [Spirochaetota bacterium]
MATFISDNKKQFLILGIMAIVFLFFFIIPIPNLFNIEVELVDDTLEPVETGNVFLNSLFSALLLTQDYAQKHVLTCLIPAFFIAGSISVFLNKGAVLRLLGKNTKKIISYTVASVSGGILAVCSCTILPLFEGIRRRGAGLGPAIAFLFSGPAINITAIFLMASVFGWNFSIFRLIASIIIAIITGLLMSLIFRKDEESEGNMFVSDDETDYSKPIIALFFFFQLIILLIFSFKQIPMFVKLSVTGISIIGFLYILIFRYKKEDSKYYLTEVWSFVKKILPYLFVGIFIAGILKIIIPESVIVSIVGSNNLLSNLIGGTFGMVTYFATLTEIPIVQGFIDLGMAKGPAMTLFLTGNSLSLPSFIVLTRNLGIKKVLVYYAIVLVFSSIAGLIFGMI